MSWFVGHKELIQLGPFRWGGAIAPWRASRLALGVLLPLALGWAFGHADYGAYTALGALPVGFVSFQGQARSRVAAVVLASLGMAVSTAVGAVTAANAPWALVPIVAVWGYLAGLAVCLGQRASTAILQWPVALLIAVGVPSSASEAALRAGLMLMGGFFQAALVAAAWAFRPGSTERAALAESYRALAAYASGLAAGNAEPPPPVEFPAGTTLEDPNPLLASAVRLTLLDLLEEAERIRASLAALSALAAEDNAAQAGEVRALIAEAASGLDLIAKAMLAANEERTALLRELRKRLHERSTGKEAPWRWASEALLGQLRAVGRILPNLDAVSLQPPAYDAATTRFLAHRPGTIGVLIDTLRANVGVTSEAGRHALRLAVTAALAEAMVQAVGLYQGRWVTLTVFLILKPDYQSTLYRGVQRAVGTLLGAGLGIAAAILAQAGQIWLVVAGGVSVAAAYALFDVNYLLFTVFLTNFIVVLLGLLGVPIVETAEARTLDTVIGAGWAIAAYAAWPTWEGASANEKFACLIEAHRKYLRRLLQEAAGSSREETGELRVLQASARRSRSDAEAATIRLSQEPRHRPLTPELAQTLIATVARLTQAELALHALVLSQHQSAGREGTAERPAGIEALAAAFDATMSELASGIRNLRAPEPMPVLRPLQVALQDHSDSRGSPLAGIIDRLVDAVDTLDAVLRDRLPADAARPEQ